MARRTYQPSPAQANADRIDRAARSGRTRKGIDRGVSPGDGIGELHGSTKEETYDAEQMIRSLANRHGCKPSKGYCPDPARHAEDAALIGPALDAFGLLPKGTPTA